MRTRWTPAVAILCLLLSTAACSRTTLPAAGSLAPADAKAFLPPLSVDVTRGATGAEEGKGTTSHWWLTSARATLTVNNETTSGHDLQVTGQAVSPSCNDGATVTFRPGSGPAMTVKTTGAPTAFAIPVEAPAGASEQIRVTIRADGCRAGSDPRTLYVALFNLTVR